MPEVNKTVPCAQNNNTVSAVDGLLKIIDTIFSITCDRQLRQNYVSLGCI